MKRVLIVGASGQLGTALTTAFGPSSELLGTAWRHARPGQVPLDVSDRAAVTALLDDWNPRVVLLAGAMCRVDRCEEEVDTCWGINVSGPDTVSEWARRRGAHVVFFSTDHVFDGSQMSYREEDAPHPLSVYARSKMEAERVIRERLPEDHLIVRTGWVFGPDYQRRNFVLQLIDRLRAGEHVPVPFDQWGSPTYTEDLARAVHLLVGRGVTGTFHATGPELIDRLSFARLVCHRFGLDANALVPQSTEALGQTAQRSLRVLLDCGKLGAAGVPAFRGIAEGLDALAAWPPAMRECPQASS